MTKEMTTIEEKKKLCQLYWKKYEMAHACALMSGRDDHRQRANYFYWMYDQIFNEIKEAQK